MNAITNIPPTKAPSLQQALHDPVWIRGLLTVVAVGFIMLFLCLPLAIVMFEAFAKG